MEHSFNIEIAKEYGILEAILLKHIYFWVEKNRANEKHFYDENYWTYNSIKAFNEMFPYASEKRIRNALKKLIDNEIICTGNYNQNHYDRTLWYTLTNKGKNILLKNNIDLPKKENGSDEKGETIPDNNTNNKTDNNIYCSNWDEMFNIFYQNYPRKVNKANAEKWFKKNKPSEELFNKMLFSLEQHKKQWKDKQFIPYPATWLNGKRWEDELEEINTEIKEKKFKIIEENGVYKKIYED